MYYVRWNKNVSLMLGRGEFNLYFEKKTKVCVELLCSKSLWPNLR